MTISSPIQASHPDLTLSSKHVTMRPLSMLDAAVIKTLMEEAKSGLYQSQNPYWAIEGCDNAIEMALHFLQKAISSYKSHGIGPLAVFAKKNGRFIGWCGYQFSPIHNTYALAFQFYPAIMNSPMSRDAVKTIIKFGEDQLDIKCLCARFNHDNTNAKALLQSVGLQFTDPDCCSDFHFLGMTGCCDSDSCC